MTGGGGRTSVLLFHLGAGMHAKFVEELWRVLYNAIIPFEEGAEEVLSNYIIVLQSALRCPELREEAARAMQIVDLIVHPRKMWIPVDVRRRRDTESQGEKQLSGNRDEDIELHQ
jgi:hypothetical protein